MLCRAEGDDEVSAGVPVWLPSGPAPRLPDCKPPKLPGVHGGVGGQDHHHRPGVARRSPRIPPRLGEAADRTPQIASSTRPPKFVCTSAPTRKPPASAG